MKQYFLFSMVFILGLGFGLGAQEDDPFADDLFGGSSLLDEENTDGDDSTTSSSTDNEGISSDDLLEKGTIIGGDFDFSNTSTFDLDAGEWYRPTNDVLLSSSIKIDARPDKDYGVLIKADLDYLDDGTTDFQLRELYADATMYDSLFVRVGKQTINWGTGYFFKPSNVVNLAQVDPQDPEAELLGPVAMKFGFGDLFTSFSRYLIFEDIESKGTLGFASHLQFLIEKTELGFGAHWRYDEEWTIFSTISTGVGDFSLFAEMALKGDINKKLISDSPSFSVSDWDNPVGFQGTAGFRYSKSTDDDLFSISIIAQYFYNGLGYADGDLLIDNQSLIAASVLAGSLTSSDITETGQHYTGVNLSFPNLFDVDLTPSVSWLGNLSDGSGFVNPKISFSRIEHFTIAVGLNFYYGRDGAEYTPLGEKTELVGEVIFTSGKF